LGSRVLPSANPAITISDVSLLEGNSGSEFAWVTLSLSAPSTQTVKVNYRTADGTAKAGSDYEAVSGTATFAPGQTSYLVPVRVYGDTLVEPDETLFLKLQNAKRATIADGLGVVTIADDGDAKPRPTVRISNASDVYEGTGSGTTLMTFTVTLSAPTDEEVTVKYDVGEDWPTGTVYGIATTSGSLTFAPGETTKEITVEIIADNVPEPNQTVYVSLRLVSLNALLGDSEGVGTIWDDDPNIYGPDYGYGLPPPDDPWYPYIA
jgi:chitinase